MTHLTQQKVGHRRTRRRTVVKTKVAPRTKVVSRSKVVSKVKVTPGVKPGAKRGIRAISHLGSVTGKRRKLV